MAINTMSEYLTKCAQTQGTGLCSTGSSNNSYSTPNAFVAISGYPRIQQNSSSVIPIVNGPLYSTSPGSMHKDLPMNDGRRMFLAEIEFGYTVGASNISRIYMTLVDRLVQTDGIVSTVLGEQTTNLPSAALPRYTDGEGVQMAIEVYSGTTQATGSTWTVTYTNSKGVAGRVTPPFLLESRSSSHTNFIALQDGDTGVRSVQSVATTTAGTVAGNLGITLFKQLVQSPMESGAQVERTGYRNLLAAGGLIELMPGGVPLHVLHEHDKRHGLAYVRLPTWGGI